jgi:hypothetical protein
MTDETPKTPRKHAIAALPTAIAIEIRRRICGSRRFMRVLGNLEPGVTRRSLVNSLAARHGVPRAAVYRLCNAIELAALADAHDRTALAVAQQMREANGSVQASRPAHLTASVKIDCIDPHTKEPKHLTLRDKLSASKRVKP